MKTAKPIFSIGAGLVLPQSCEATRNASLEDIWHGFVLIVFVLEKGQRPFSELSETSGALTGNIIHYITYSKTN